MIKIYLKYLLSFILLILTQIFVLNKINMFGFITPMIYIVFIFSLPFQMPRWIVIILGFLMGLCIDLFTGIIGIHALATLTVAFIRVFIINLISLRIDREEHIRPIFADMKFKWYFQYAFLLTLIHHLVYFFADIFNFHDFWQTIIVVLSNTAVSVICIFLIQIFFYRPTKRY